MSRVAFAEESGIDSTILTRIEHLRTPLRYPVFRAIHQRFKISPAWLIGEDVTPVWLGPMNDGSFLSQVPTGTLFSEVWERHIKAEFEPLVVVASTRAEKLSSAMSTLLAAIKNDPATLDAIPDDTVRELLKVIDRLDRLCSQQLRKQAQFERGLSEANQKDSLTCNPVVSTVPPTVKEIKTWPELRERLNKLTSDRGAKAALAKARGVTPQAVSDWLRGVYSPEADTVLWLLRWVENPQPFQKQKRSGSATNTAAAQTTQSKGSVANETTRPGRKKK